MPSPREEKIRESYREGIARAIRKAGKDWLRDKDVWYGWADVPDEVFADACLTYLRTRHPFLPEVLAELKDEEAMRKETR
jgi:hypothetical protein